MGGTSPNVSQCDTPAQFGFHNLDLGKQNPRNAMWYPFRPNITTYAVPTEIISVVGGSATGGATASVPAGGFNEPDLAVYFTRIYQPVSRAATRVIPATGTSTMTAGVTPRTVPVGAVIGASIGGAAVLFAAFGIGVALCCVIRNGKASANLHTYWDGREMEPNRLYPQHPSFVASMAQLPGGEPGRTMAAELSSPEGEAAAARLARYYRSPIVPTPPSSSPTVPPLPLNTSSSVHLGYPPFSRDSPPAQRPQHFPVPHSYRDFATVSPTMAHQCSRSGNPCASCGHEPML